MRVEEIKDERRGRDESNGDRQVRKSSPHYGSLTLG